MYLRISFMGLAVWLNQVQSNGKSNLMSAGSLPVAAESISSQSKAIKPTF